MPHNILYIDSAEDMFGGGQVSLLELLKNLDRAKFRPIAIVSEKGKLWTRINEIGIDCRIKPFPAIRPCNIISFLKYVKILRNFIVENKIKLVHTNTSRSTVYAICALKKSNIPVVWHARVALRDFMLDRFILKNVPRIIAVSQAVRDRFPMINDKNISIVYNGVDINEFIPGSKDESLMKKYGVYEKDFVVGVLGRFSPEKGHAYLVKAIELIKSEVPNLKVLMIGSGDSGSIIDLKMEIKKSDVVSNFIFTGFTDNTAEMLRLCDMFCLPSLTEGFSRSLLEAMACGLPVAATSVGGNVEIVKNGVNGILVTPQRPEALADAIKELSGDRIKAKKMGIEGRKLIEEKFRIDTNVAETQKIYTGLLLNND
jgi:glycosyltransferase involved in cell wall biosynthesis